MKRLHLIANAHIDPVWLWNWEEGAAATLSTFQSAADLAEEFDYVFCHNEAILYEWIQEYSPALYAHIGQLIRRGKWRVMGGWYLQPDCNLSSGESLVRQIMTGRQYFEENFGARPTTAVNVDPFGHSRGLVQIMAKAGYDSYLFCRPYPEQLTLEDDNFIWEGFEGSTLRCYRAQMGYLSLMGTTTAKIAEYLQRFGEDHDVGLVMWGVGNHGGGPSRLDLAQIAELMAESPVKIMHSTPEQYFADAPEPTLRFTASLYPSMVGCYTSQNLVKARHRALENQYYSTEKMCTAAALAGKLEYPAAELEAALKDLMFMEFHDILPGTAIKTGENDALRTMDHGLEILSRLRLRAFLGLSEGQAKTRPGEYTLLVYNPHPYPVRQPVVCEFQLENQNWGEDLTAITVFDRERQLPAQQVKEESNLNLDWRKRMMIDCTLAPQGMTRLTCRTHMEDEKSVYPAVSGRFVFENGGLRAELDTATGLLDRLTVDGEELLTGGALQPVLIEDNEDPWGMAPAQNLTLGEEVGDFRLMDARESAELAGWPDKTLPPVRIIEDGEVATVVEACFTHGRSALVVKYTFYKVQDYIDLDYTVFWNEKNRALKLKIPTPLTGDFLGEAPYGTDTLPGEGHEVPFQKWCALQGGNAMLAVTNREVYGGSRREGTLYLTLLRAPCYSAHPIKERPIIPQDRYMPRIDQGERSFSFRLLGGAVRRLAEVPAQAQVFNEQPFALCVFPTGQGEAPRWRFELDTPQVLLTAQKLDRQGRVVLRLFNSGAKPAAAKLTAGQSALSQSFDFGPFEIKTVILEGDVMRETGGLDI